MPNTSIAGLSLRDLEYAVAVGNERHFGRAAESCSVSQAALSEQVRKLESLLGFSLFERTKRHVEPTARGIAVLRQAETVLAEARRLLDSARRSAEPMTGDLRIGAIATLGPYYLPALLAKGRARFPLLSLRLHEGRTAELLERLRRGELDTVLCALPVPLDGLTAEPLFFEPFVLAAPSDHPLATRESIGVRELRRAELLLMEEGHCLRDQALDLCNMRRTNPTARFASSLEMLRHMIAAGEGCSFLPLTATNAGIDMHGLVTYRELNDPTIGRTIGMVWRTTETRVADLREVAAFLREALPAGTHGMPQPA